jgi:hypothetical protein
MMMHPFLAHRRALVAASFAGLAILAVAPKSYAKIPGTPAAANQQITHKDPATAEPSWAFQREGSTTHSPTFVSGAVREQVPMRTSPAADRLLSQIRREQIPEPEARTAAELPASSGWDSEVAFGTGLFAAFVMAAGMTLVIRRRRSVSTAH